MINVNELKPVYVFSEDKGEGYLYKGRFIPKGVGSLSEGLLKHSCSYDISDEMNSQHPLVVDRLNVNLEIEFIANDKICGDWFRINETK
ncbi:hypothetical protein [Paenibacillus taichungensis]|uniref:hypothetical protein n=1 Tax=Paenibacillus taichungensis TaxID=484184 RepID=UPI00399FECEF